MHTRPSLLIITIVGAVSACTSADSPARRTLPARPPAVAQMDPAAGARAFPTLDEKLANVAQRVPAFGGLYITKDGTAHILLKDASAKAQAVAAISEVMGNIPHFSDRPLTVHTARYNFAELLEMKRRVTSAILGAHIPSIALVGIGHASNDVEVGVYNESAIGAVQAALASAGFANGSVHVAVVPALHPASTLQDHVRPLQGGLIVTIATPGQLTAGSCSYGLTLKKSSPDENFYALTASHCTNTQGAVDPNYISQPYTGSSDEGQESDDYPFFTYNQDPTDCVGGVDTGQVCRWADASLFVFFSALQSTDGAQSWGLVAHTLSSGNGQWGVGGSTTLNDTTFLVASEAPDSWLVPGQLVQKVGATTGWTWGYIWSTANGDTMDGSCVDTFFNLADDPSQPNDHVNLCQYWTHVYAYRGDSGGAVFMRGILDSVYFQGITSMVGDSTMMFSSIDGIQREYGHLRLSPVSP